MRVGDLVTWTEGGKLKSARAFCRGDRINHSRLGEGEVLEDLGNGNVYWRPDYNRCVGVLSHHMDMEKV